MAQTDACVVTHSVPHPAKAYAAKRPPGSQQGVTAFFYKANLVNEELYPEGLPQAPPPLGIIADAGQLGQCGPSLVTTLHIPASGYIRSIMLLLIPK